MSGMRPSPIGQKFCARDGGLVFHVEPPPDLLIAEAAAGGKDMEVKGTAIRYGVVGHFPLYGALRVEPGALTAPGNHWRKRDAILSLIDHNSGRVMGRTDKGTMSVAFSDEGITYAVRLNPEDPEAQSLWAKIRRGDVDASSVGFIPLEGDWVEAEDNGLDAEPADEGEKIDVFAVTSAALLEISFVAQGAFDGATSMPASRTADEPLEVALPFSEGKVAADLAVMVRSEDDTDETSDPDVAPDGEFGGGEGDEPPGGGETADGAAEPDGDGGDGIEAQAEAERQGLTLKELMAQMPSDLRRRL